MKKDLLTESILVSLLVGAAAFSGTPAAFAQDFTNYDSRTAGSLAIQDGANTFTTTTGYNHAAALSVGNANVSIAADTTNTFTAVSGGAGIKAALMAGNGGSVTVTAGGDNTFSGGEKGLFAVNQVNVPVADGDGRNTITITSTGGSNQFTGSLCGLRIGKSDSQDTMNRYLRTVLGQSSSGTYDPTRTPGYSVTIAAENDNRIHGDLYAIYTDARSTIDITAETGTNEITSYRSGIFASDGNQVTLTAGKGNTVSGDENGLFANSSTTILVGTESGDNVVTSSYGDGLLAMNQSRVSLQAGSGSNFVKDGGQWAVGNSRSTVTLSAGDNYIGATDTGEVPYMALVGTAEAADPDATAETTLTATEGSNQLVGYFTAVALNGTAMANLSDAATKVGTLTMQAARDNILEGTGFVALDADGAQEAVIEAGHSNQLTGARGGAFVSRLSHLKLEAGEGDNVISGSHVGLLTEKSSDTEISSQNGRTQITASGDGYGGRGAAVLSLAGGHTTINGKTDISGNIALGAGHTYTETYQGINEKAHQEFSHNPEKYRKRMLKEFNPSLTGGDRDQSWIKVNYGSNSSITGRVLTLAGGAIAVSPREGGGMTFNGDACASSSPRTANSYADILGYVGPYTTLDQLDTVSAGTIDLDLGRGSVWNGKADTGLLDNQQNGTSHAVGTLNVGLGSGSIWNLSASSALTRLYGSGGTVRFKNGGDSLQLDTLTEPHTFAMDLDYADPASSDMLYIGNGTADSQTLEIKNGTDLKNQMQAGDRVRFATVRNAGMGFTEGRRYQVGPHGIYNDGLTVRYVPYRSDPETRNYDGDGTRKPATETVAETYGGTGAYNVYLEKFQELNDGAKSAGRAADIVWRSVTDPDTFTNRSGETRYFTPGADQGAWIRFRYRNLGVDGIAEIDGNTYEAGYTAVASDTPEKKHRFSASLAYSRETGDWEGMHGDLAVRDMTVSLYDTQEFFPSAEKMAAKPAWKQGTHSYWDTYLKYHHVRSDYTTIDHQTGQDYHGKYSQNAFSLSTEYGRENKLGKAWSIVPQVQVQASWLGAYDDVDSGGIAVSAGHEWSLLGRVGFDLVRKMDPRLDSRLYFKASLLHEFLDGYDVTVACPSQRHTFDGDEKGTWGVLGLGYSARIGTNQYFYVDGERCFGHDFKRTYHVRAGVNWKF
jgi:outer membrane autotransporter protein